MVIRKSITVKRPLERTFSAFTAEIGRWWPLKDFSFGRDKAKDLFLEGWVGGRLYERFSNGDEFTIGTVTFYEKPNRVTFTWRQPDWSSPTEIDVRFSSGPEGTLVELEHRGWNLAGAEGAVEQYGQGWDVILKHFDRSTEG